MTCTVCKGIRFKKCLSCGGAVNSYHDFRDYGVPTYSDKYVERGEQRVPERPLQPPHK